MTDAERILKERQEHVIDALLIFAVLVAFTLGVVVELVVYL